jgi:hypothetical protein
MMQQNIAPADGAKKSVSSRKAAATGATNGGSRKLRRMIAFGHGHEADRVERAVDDKQILLGQAEVFQQHGANFQRATLFDLQPHGVALAAVLQFASTALSRLAASSSSA